MLMLLLATAALAGLFYYYCVKPFTFWKDRGVEQGNPNWIFGHYWRNFIGKKNGTDVLLETYRANPKLRYTGFYRFFTPVLVVNDPELIREITVKDFDAFSDHVELIPAEADPLWSNNLLSLTGVKWREMRTHLSPSFTGSKICLMFTQMAECAENLVSHLLKKDQEEATIEVKDIFSRFTNDVIAATVFGVKVDSLAHENNEFYQMGNEVADFSNFRKIFRMFLFWFVPVIRKVVKVQIIPEEAGRFFRGIVDDTLKTREEKGIVRPDMLHLLAETRKKLEKQKVDGENKTSDGIPKFSMDITKEDITAHALIFFIAGFESVSSSISFTAYELAVNPDVQEKLREEIRSTLEKYDGKVTYEVVMEMKYLDMVVSEAFRKWPHFTFMNRKCTKSHTIEPIVPGEKPVHIEKGTELNIPMFAIHHDPKYYPNPERFDPERFSEENKRNIQPYTYFPFGLGPRNCVGARFTLIEMKVVLFHLLARFEIVPVERTAIPLRFQQNTVVNLKPVDGFWLGFKRLKV